MSSGAIRKLGSGDSKGPLNPCRLLLAYFPLVLGSFLRAYFPRFARWLSVRFCGQDIPSSDIGLIPALRADLRLKGRKPKASVFPLLFPLPSSWQRPLSPKLRCVSAIGSNYGSVRYSSLRPDIGLAHVLNCATPTLRGDRF